MNDILYYKELETWRAKLDFDLHVTVDRGDKNWRGEVGVVTTLIKKFLWIGIIQLLLFVD